MAAMTFSDFADELIGFFSEDLPPDYARRCVNRAWRNIRGARRWSFLRGIVSISVPALIADGHVNAVQYTNTVTGDATAGAAWLAQALGVPPLISRQFRILGGSIYSITAYDSGTNTITLDRPLQESSNATAEYQIYQCYYPAPADFLRWESITDYVNAYPIRRENLARTRDELDRIDPQRQSFSNPVYAVPFTTTADGLYLFEFWPHPIQQLGYTATFEKKGYDDYSDTANLPPQIPEELLAIRSQYYAMKWAALQPKFQSAKWDFLMAENKADYNETLKRAMKNDEEAFLQNFSQDQSGRPNYPVDSNWMQSHDV